MTGTIVAMTATTGMLAAGLIGLRSKQPARQAAIVCVATIAWAVVITLVVIGSQ